MQGSLIEQRGKRSVVDALIRSCRDRDDISNQIARVAFAQDAQDWDAIGAVYVEGAVYVHPGGRLDGVAAIIELNRGALQVLDGSQHLIGTIDITVEGDTASSTAYFQAQHVRAGTPGGDLYLIAGSYADRWVRRAEGWLIASRNQTYQWCSGNHDVVAR
jgi:ketosteroid isomerase-like protein